MRPILLAGAALAGGVAALLLFRSPSATKAPDLKPFIPVVAVNSPVKPPSPTPMPIAPTDMAVNDHATEPTVPTAQATKDNAARLAGLFDAFPEKKQLFDELLSEKRDPQWAPQSEAMLTEYFAGIPHIGGPGRILSAYCGSRSCALILDLPSSGQPQDRWETMAAVQSLDHVKAMFAKGYWDNGASFGPSSSDNRPMFVRFYRRGEPLTFGAGRSKPAAP